MLKAIDYTGKKKSVYICDRCGKRINTSSERRYKVSIRTPKGKTSVMKTLNGYDLCRCCTGNIINMIEKGK